jgi:hypothetical protein
MPVLSRSENIWMFGKKYVWNVYHTNAVLNAFQYRQQGTPPAPSRNQKNQICIHYTASNGGVEGVVSFWSTLAGQTPPKNASAHFIIGLARDRLDPAQPYSDVSQPLRAAAGDLVESDMITWHGGPINTASIGIETTNVGWDWNQASGDTYTGAGIAKRPTDQNHWLHIGLPNVTGAFPFSNMSHRDFQYYEEEQYWAFYMLLRSLCIKHRIPRRFLGDTPAEKFRRYWDNLGADQILWRNRLMHFRGILSHMNTSGPPASKECGGPALHRNRLFRGIIDEWWLPIQLDGSERPYYHGPFDPQTGAPSYFRWNGTGLQAELFHDADLDALQETKSYFDLENALLYYAWTEDAARGGTFPIGVNRIWHGGVHFEPPATNQKVYAAASGTIVAARLGGDDATEKDPEYGSQRFVLIRHCVYMDQEADPAGGRRVAYTGDPHYVFTLYMHLAPFANLTAADNNNPPWFNYWLRHRTAAADANAVFYPQVPVPAGELSGIPVSVGDWIGSCGQYRGRNLLHFEVMSREEFTMAPWDDPNLRVSDTNQTLLCNAPALDNFVKSRTGKGIDEVDIMRAAPQLRTVKSFHKSEWALTGPDSLVGLLPKPEMRQTKWNRLQHFMWVADAVAACPDLSAQLCDATGMVWHYHPVTFMKYVNELVTRENQQVQDYDSTQTNVALEGEFLTRFIDWASPSDSFVDGSADAAALRPYDVSSNQFSYHFTRRDVGCLALGLHSPGPTPPNATRFALSLLDVLECAREIYGKSMTVVLSYLCDGHNDGTDIGMCALLTNPGHNAGYAVDIRPSSQTPAECRSLWQAVNQAITTYNSGCTHEGEPSHADVDGAASASASPALQSKLQAGTALTNSEAASFLLHLQISQPISSIVWECYVKRPTKALAVRLEGGGIVGTYANEADANSECPSGSCQAGGVCDGFLVSPSQATAVRLQMVDGVQSVIGVYLTTEAAETEKGSDFAWPKQVTTP